jgi:hypothetical protein
MTIRRKLNTIQLVTAASVLVLASGVFVWNDLRTFQSTQIARVNSYAELIGENAIPTLVFHDAIVAGEILGTLSVAEDITHAGIYDGTGTLFATYTLPGYATSALKDSPGEGHHFGEEYLSFTCPSIGTGSWSVPCIYSPVLPHSGKRRLSL